MLFFANLEQLARNDGKDSTPTSLSLFSTSPLRMGGVGNLISYKLEKNRQRMFVNNEGIVFAGFRHDDGETMFYHMSNLFAADHSRGDTTVPKREAGSAASETLLTKSGAVPMDEMAQEENAMQMPRELVAILGSKLATSDVAMLASFVDTGKVGAKAEDQNAGRKRKMELIASMSHLPLAEVKLLLDQQKSARAVKRVKAGDVKEENAAGIAAAVGQGAGATTLADVLAMGENGAKSWLDSASVRDFQRVDWLLKQPKGKSLHVIKHSSATNHFSQNT